MVVRWPVLPSVLPLRPFNGILGPHHNSNLVWWQGLQSASPCHQGYLQQFFYVLKLNCTGLCPCIFGCPFMQSPFFNFDAVLRAKLGNVWLSLLQSITAGHFFSIELSKRLPGLASHSISYMKFLIELSDWLRALGGDLFGGTHCRRPKLLHIILLRFLVQTTMRDGYGCKNVKGRLPVSRTLHGTCSQNIWNKRLFFALPLTRSELHAANKSPQLPQESEGFTAKPYLRLLLW